MLFRHDTVKRLIASLGVMLTAVAALQQCRALCALSGCTGLAPTVTSCPATILCDCCHSGSSERNNHHRSTSPSDDNFPCFPTCWCCQPLEPREAPRNTTGAVALSLLSNSDGLATATIIGHYSASSIFQSVPPDILAGNSSCEICVRFCRFLI
jgi:hypothetical protein